MSAELALAGIWALVTIPAAVAGVLQYRRRRRR